MHARHHCVRVLVSLAVGLFVTGLIVFLSAWFAVPTYGGSHFVAERYEPTVRDFWLIHEAGSWATEYVTFERTHSGAWTVLGLDVSDGFPELPGWATPPVHERPALYVAELRMAVGWPLRCVVATASAKGITTVNRARPRRAAKPVSTETAVCDAIKKAKWTNVFTVSGGAPATQAPVVPYGIIASGFTLDVLILSGGLLAVLYTLLVVTYWWRRARGRCPRCAYPALPSHGCSECGWRRVDAASDG